MAIGEDASGCTAGMGGSELERALLDDEVRRLAEAKPALSTDAGLWARVEVRLGEDGFFRARVAERVEFASRRRDAAIAYAFQDFAESLLRGGR